MNDELRATTVLTKATQIVTLLASAPAPTSEIMLAQNDDYSLIVGNNKFMGGFHLTLISRKTSGRFAIAGYRAREVKSTMTVKYLIALAQSYIKDVINRTPPPMVTVPPQTPVTALDNVRDAIEELTRAIAHVCKNGDAPLLSNLTSAKDSLLTAQRKLQAA